MTPEKRGRAAQLSDEEAVLLAHYARQVARKGAAGRYTMQEAAHLIAAGTNEHENLILGKLERAAKEHELITCGPGQNASREYGKERGQSSEVRNFYEEAFWDDLNQWLEKYERRISFRFPPPQNQVEAPAASPADKSAVAHPETRRPQTEPMTPEIQAASANEPMWTLKKPSRYQGYRKPLYDVLKAANEAGLPCPTARDVLDTFSKKLPHEIISVMSDGMNYYDGDGNSKAATLRSISKTIDRLVQ